MVQRGLSIDDSRIAVFNNGICEGLNGKISIGGHKDTISIVGGKLVWGRESSKEWNEKKEHFRNNK